MREGTSKKKSELTPSPSHPTEIAPAEFLHCLFLIIPLPLFFPSSRFQKRRDLYPSASTIMLSCSNKRNSKFLDYPVYTQNGALLINYRSSQYFIIFQLLFLLLLSRVCVCSLQHNNYARPISSCSFIIDDERTLLRLISKLLRHERAFVYF